jgi:hypothetical protein
MQEGVLPTPTPCGGGRQAVSGRNTLGNALNYLRFSPAEYRDITRVCRTLDLRRLDPPAFQRLAALCLADAASKLARRIRGLLPAEVRLLHGRLRAEVEGGRRSSFSPEELRALAGACGPVPPGVRFIGPFQGAFVRRLRHASPGLSRKLARLSVGQFVRLFGEVRLRWGG